jgi:hypothetical protein
MERGKIMRIERRAFTLTVLALHLVFAASVAAEDSVVVVPRGTKIELELLHHLNSSYSGPGSDVFLAVAEDVIVDGRTAIPRGHVVRGVMKEAMESKKMGRAGHLSFHVDSVVAPDGTEIPLNADFHSYGRDRSKAVGHMSAAFGLFGALAKGRMAYLEKGADFTAIVSENCEVSPTSWTYGTEEVRPVAREGEASLRDDDVTLAIEKGRRIRPIEVSFEPPVARALTPEELGSLAIVEIDGLTLPRPVWCQATYDTSHDSDGNRRPEHTAECHGWDVLKYCEDGISQLVFQVAMDDGSVASATADIDVKIRKK